MALRNAFQRSSSLLPMRSRPSVIPRALGHRYILPPNAQRYTVQSDRRLWPLVGFVALLGGLEICHAVGKNTKPELSSKNETVTQTHVIPPELIQYALDEVKRQGFPMDVEDKEAYFKQEVSRYEALCRDGLFIQTPISDRWLTYPIRIEGHRSSNMLVQSVETVPGNQRPEQSSRNITYPQPHSRNPHGDVYSRSRVTIAIAITSRVWGEGSAFSWRARAGRGVIPRWFVHPNSFQ